MHATIPDRRRTVADQLVQLLGPGFGGRPDRRRMMLIMMLAHEATRLAGDDYGEEKARAVIRWSGIACSAGGYKAWGLPNAERFALENACRLRRHLLCSTESGG